MTEFLSDILNGRDNILIDMGQHGQDLLDLCERVRDTPMDELDNDDKR